MGRKKKAVPAEPQKPEEKADLKTPVNGQAAKIEVETTITNNMNREGTMELALEPNPDLLRKDADAFARECGFVGDFKIDGPNREEYPRFGHGYVLTIRELSGKQRMATAKYTKDGVRGYWQQDSMLTG